MDLTRAIPGRQSGAAPALAVVARFGSDKPTRGLKKELVPTTRLANNKPILCEMYSFRRASGPFGFKYHSRHRSM